MADKFDRYAWLTALAIAPIGLIASVDLLTGWLEADGRLDVGMLAALALGLWGAYSMRRLAKRLRVGGLEARPALGQWIGSIASMAVALSVTAGIGYLIGGWIVAALLPGATIVLITASILSGLRRRRLAKKR